MKLRNKKIDRVAIEKNNIIDDEGKNFQKEMQELANQKRQVEQMVKEIENNTTLIYERILSTFITLVENNPNKSDFSISLSCEQSSFNKEIFKFIGLESSGDSDIFFGFDDNNMFFYEKLITKLKDQGISIIPADEVIYFYLYLKSINEQISDLLLKRTNN